MYDISKYNYQSFINLDINKLLKLKRFKIGYQLDNITVKELFYSNIYYTLCYENDILLCFYKRHNKYVEKIINKIKECLIVPLEEESPIATNFFLLSYQDNDFTLLPLSVDPKFQDVIDEKGNAFIQSEERLYITSDNIEPIILNNPQHKFIYCFDVEFLNYQFSKTLYGSQKSIFIFENPVKSREEINSLLKSLLMYDLDIKVIITQVNKSKLGYNI